MTVAQQRTTADVPAFPAWQFVILLVAIGAGWGLSHVLDLQGIAGTQGFLYGATTLLAVGLYGSTTQIIRPGISRPDIFQPEFRFKVRVVLLAVTVGVGAKAALIAAVMYLAYHDPRYLVLGVAIAQIDPLSVAALQRNSKLSERAKSILYAWSSFDDPVTTLLTIYAAALTLNMLGMEGGLVGADLGSFALQMLANLVFAAVTAIVWLAFTRRAGISILSDGTKLSRWQNLVAVIVLAAFIIFAIWQFLILGLAIAGLFFRPYLGPWINRVTQVAILLATVALGVLLVDGVALLPGLLLGTAAFAAHAVVSMVLTLKLPRSDRAYLALSQQNGITAIILALFLERSFAGTAAVVAPAIFVINTLHLSSTSALTWVLERRTRRENHSATSSRHSGK